MRDDTDDYLALFLHDVPLMDVRAPVEFAEGAFPLACNIPLLDDLQRTLVGTRYREAGQHAAVALGLELATPALRQQRLETWQAWFRAHPQGYLYCFRGGLRSHTVQNWLGEAGLQVPLIRGGYKAMRRFLLNSLQATLSDLPLLVLSGPTGSGKTRVLQSLQRQVDLEALARHRGSAFGQTLQAQPAQIDWENALAIALLKLQQASPGQCVVLEDESRLIGRVHLPPLLQHHLRSAPKVLIETALAERCALIRQDYIDTLWPAFQQRFGETAPSQFRQQVLGNLQRIRRRLGEERHARVQSLFAAGLDAPGGFDHAAFEAGIRILLEEYYDPLYHYQLQRSSGPIRFRGNAAVVRAWLHEQCGAQP